ncbi:MAG: hypothetical protein JO204_19185 [Alphaproteobacteria bacterium]|nr:hypothetical protein [Alphaproteobacteria bacterium]
MHGELDLKPGSPEAVAQGCICPPQTSPDAIYDVNCPVHAAADQVEPDLAAPSDPEVA